MAREEDGDVRLDGAVEITGTAMVGVSAMGAATLGVRAGTSTNDAGVGGVLYETRTATGNFGAGEDDLGVYSVPANTLSQDGMGLRFEAWGSLANNANSKRVRVRFGTAGVSQMFDTTAMALANQWWMVRGRLVRTGAATQKSFVDALVGGSGGGTVANAFLEVATGLNQTLSGAVSLRITGEAVANNDVVLQSFFVEWLDNNT